MNNSLSPEKFLLTATIITLELVKGKSFEEIALLKNLFNTISNNLQSYLNQKGKK